MKQKRFKFSMKRKIFFYLIGFASVMLVFLWLFQVVFLDKFYQEIKIQQTKKTANTIVEKLNQEDNTEFIDAMSEESDYCISVLIIENNRFQYQYQNQQNKGICGYQQSSVNDLYKEAATGNGTVLAYATSQKIYDENSSALIDGYLYEEDSSSMQPNVQEEPQSITYGVISETENAQQYFVLVNSRITIISEIAQTIYIQLLIIMAFLIMLAFIVAFIISSRISKPIIKINESAKQLAKGDFEIQFEGKGYLEIEELNETLNYASKELNKVEQLRKELIANMSHDLRTPLTMIAGYGEVMRDIPNENTPENVQVIIDECHRLTTLVNDILDLSKLQSGTQVLNTEEINITQLIKGMIKRLKTLLKQDQFDIEFIYTKDVFICADEVKINQVIYNLIVNAIHYTGEDHKVIIKQMISKDKVCIEVIDSGEGIAKEEIPYIWDRYYKLDKVHKRSQVGTGLGLSIVKGILELHQATYGVISEDQKGTTFYFTLKIKNN